MSIREFLEWQWNGYPKYHRSRTNLLTHIIAVPLFVTGNAGLVISLVRGSLIPGAVSLIVMILSMAIQGRGHRIEEMPPEPFASATNAVSRIVLEQWVTFPRFVITGGWWRALRAAPAKVR